MNMDYQSRIKVFWTVEFFKTKYN